MWTSSDSGSNATTGKEAADVVSENFLIANYNAGFGVDVSGALPFLSLPFSSLFLPTKLPDAFVSLPFAE